MKSGVVEKPAPVLALTSPDPEDVSRVLEPDDPDIEKLYAIKKAVEFMWDDTAPLDWEGADTRAAKAAVGELPNWSPDQLAFAVVCRFRSFHINSAEAPRHWLKKLRKYRLGPLDKYDHDKLLNPQERQQYREEVLAMLAGRKPGGQQVVLPIVG